MVLRFLILLGVYRTVEQPALPSDGIPNELPKYSKNIVLERFASIINNRFETYFCLYPPGQANITPPQKPKKLVGPLKYLRLLTLSNAVRKIRSISL